MSLKQITIDLNGEKQIKMKLDTKSLLKEIRTVLLDSITFPFKFVYIDEDDQEQEVPIENEIKKSLSDILDSRYLHIKKEKKIREILGQKLYQKGDLEFYLFPKVQFTSLKLECASNIMIVGETGVGKSTWIHAFLNYMQGIQIEENIRYLLFNEKEKQEKYAKKYGEKQKGSSVTDIPEVYNIEQTVLFDNPIRLIDTAGFGDTRGKEFDEKITKDIQKLFENWNLKNLNAICIIFKASDTRCHERSKDILDKLFSLFGEDIKKNIIIIFTFADSYTNIPALTALKNKDAPFYKILGDIEDIPYFAFNNQAYFSNERDTFKIPFEKNQINFGKLIKYIFSLRSITLEKTREVIKNRDQIKTKIFNLTVKLNDIIKYIDSALYSQKNISEDQKELNYLENNNIEYIEKYYEPKIIKTVKDVTKYCSSGWYVLYCNNCNKICHYNCKGPNEGWHSTEYGCNIIYTISSDCANCDCYWQKHSFQTSYTVKEEVSTTEKVEKFRENKEKKQKKEDNEKLKKEIREKIEKNKNDFNENNKKIYNYLISGINCLYDLSKKNEELNKIALMKDDENEKHGYTDRTLKETMTEKNEISSFFEDSLQDIDNICSSETNKDKKVNNFIKLLLEEHE